MKTKEKNDLQRSDGFRFSSHNVECDRSVYTNDTEQFKPSI